MGNKEENRFDGEAWEAKEKLALIDLIAESGQVKLGPSTNIYAALKDIKVKTEWKDKKMELKTYGFTQMDPAVLLLQNCTMDEVIKVLETMVFDYMFAALKDNQKAKLMEVPDWKNKVVEYIKQKKPEMNGGHSWNTAQNNLQRIILRMLNSQR